MSNDTPFIRAEPVARKYELNFDSETVSFELKIRKEAFEFFQTHEKIRETFTQTQGGFSLPLWNFDSENTFGFGDCFNKTSEENGWITLTAPLSPENDLALAVTFSEIFPILHHIIDNVRPQPGETEQEMFLETMCSKELQHYGAAMDADLSKEFSLWMYDQNDELRATVNPLVYTAMCKAHTKLTRSKPHGNTGGLTAYGFLIYPPYGVYTCQFGVEGKEQDRFKRSGGYGYETFCHNLDHRRQQLVILAGFATICQIFRSTKAQTQV